LEIRERQTVIDLTPPKETAGRPKSLSLKKGEGLGKENG